MKFSVAYIAASTNRHSYAADISESLVAFGSSNLVCLWSLDDDRIIQSLPGHEGLVTSLRFVSKDSFVSGDDKGVVLLWKNQASQWTFLQVQAHDKPISTLCVYEDCLATGSSDSLVKIWAIKGSDRIGCLQSLSLRGRYPLAIALSKLPASKSLLLAVAGTDKNINLWTRVEGGVFAPSLVLSGHEDWIRSLSFLVPPSESEPLILASGSQDATIRLWNIEIYSKEEPSADKSNFLSDELLDAFEASLGDTIDGEEGGRQISLKQHLLVVKSDEASPQRFSVTFDALLIGHEAAVTCLSWRANSSVPILLSTSTDSSLILWSPSTVISGSQDKSSALWINRSRFGDVGGQRYGGFVGGLWTKKGSQVMAWGWAGGWRSWRRESFNEDDTWTEVGAVGGHRGPVKDVAWCPNGDYLISTGVDQTTRIHAPVPGPSKSTWHELARPQVHGYDLQGVVFIDPLKFVSIADEKAARVFEAPKGFVTLLQTLIVSHFDESKADRPGGATVPPLGLSNKASNEVSDQALKSTTRRPFEGELASITLWPEIEKIFGHGYESITLGVSNSRRLVATACRATTAEHAVIRIYDTEKWQPVGEPLEGHNLTVTRVSFSPDDRYVLTVSRDRSWRLFGIWESGGYKPLTLDKSHGRIIWDCAWAREGDVFATASRDKTVRIWSGNHTSWTALTTILTKEAATAIDFRQADGEHRRLLAVGLEKGDVVVYSNILGSSDWTEAMTCKAHADHVQRLAWRPGESSELASCSEDGTIKVLHIE